MHSHTIPGVDTCLAPPLGVLTDALSHVGDGRGRWRGCGGSQDVARRLGDTTPCKVTPVHPVSPALPPERQALEGEAEVADAGSKRLLGLVLGVGGLRIVKVMLRGSLECRNQFRIHWRGNGDI